ncbi:MAG TPA: SGNH/GDSL hydrolase family protein [Candidatus Cybelea sp.]|jgi:lysophospholipase L1-like esterase
MKIWFRSILATTALAAVAACGGGGGATSPSFVPPGQTHVKPGPDVISNIVGVGDSLTAGYQSDGFLGATGVTAGGVPVPPNQENGWWSLLYEQASGKPLDTAVTQMYDPSTSPLPLIKGPGLDNQIINPNNGFFPIASSKTGDVCSDNNGFNNAGYHLKGVARVRMDPTSANVRNVGVPGLTLHEANVLHAPQSNTCKELPGIPGLLNMVVAEESGTFWPVLGTYAKMHDLTDVNAAASRHPTLATVWLGANDVLKYMGSGGRFVGGDRNAAQAEGDLRQSIGTLQHAGAKVAVANLPDILLAGYFERVSIPQKLTECRIRSYVSCLFYWYRFPNSLVTAIATKYHLTTPGGCTPASTTKPCGYLTIPAVAAIVQTYASAGVVPNLDCTVPAPNCKGAPGNGLGQNYITPEFAGRIQSLENAINQGIDHAASAQHVPLVDVQAIFSGLASGNPSNPYFKLAASINPKDHCCTLGYLFGITSFDGLHPSNTGYALIAFEFINAINKAYGTHIPQVDVGAAYAGTRCSNTKYCFPDPYAPPNDLTPP